MVPVQFDNAAGDATLVLVLRFRLHRTFAVEGISSVDDDYGFRTSVPPTISDVAAAPRPSVGFSPYRRALI